MQLLYHNHLCMCDVMGIDFVDMIVARRSINKGTQTVKGPIEKVDFMGDRSKKHDEERLKLAGDLMILSAKGTKKIKLSEMSHPKKPLLKGKKAVLTSISKKKNLFQKKLRLLKNGILLSLTTIRKDGFRQGLNVLRELKYSLTLKAGGYQHLQQASKKDLI